MGQITELIQASHETARKKKFWDALTYLQNSDDVNAVMDKSAQTSIISQCYGNRLMHVTRELGEAWEEYRVNGKTDHFDEELADAVIVLFDVCGAMGVDLESSILKKMNKNLSRPDKHGKRF